MRTVKVYKFLSRLAPLESYAFASFEYSDHAQPSTGQVFGRSCGDLATIREANKLAG
jgi:hypothetical protein